MTTSSERGTVTNAIEKHKEGYYIPAVCSHQGRKLLIPIHDLVPVHVCWNGQRGDRKGKLTAVEFTHDCEICCVETDPLHGDDVEVCGDTDEAGWFSIDGDYLFRFSKAKRHVGNIMWDMIWMPKEEAGRFAEYLQEHKHWTLTVAATEIFNRWGNLTGEEFIRLLEEMSR